MIDPTRSFDTAQLQMRSVMSFLRESGLLSGIAHPLAAAAAIPSEPERGVCICGRTISRNKDFCLGCSEDAGREALARRLAAQISTGRDLELLLADAGRTRHIVLESILPYLSFVPDRELDRFSDDGCPN